MSDVKYAWEDGDELKWTTIANINPEREAISVTTLAKATPDVDYGR